MVILNSKTVESSKHESVAQSTTDRTPNGCHLTHTDAPINRRSLCGNESEDISAPIKKKEGNPVAVQRWKRACQKIKLSKIWLVH